MKTLMYRTLSYLCLLISSQGIHAASESISSTAVPSRTVSSSDTFAEVYAADKAKFEKYLIKPSIDTPYLDYYFSTPPMKPAEIELRIYPELENNDERMSFLSYAHDCGVITDSDYVALRVKAFLNMHPSPIIPVASLPIWQYDPLVQEHLLKTLMIITYDLNQNAFQTACSRSALLRSLNPEAQVGFIIKKLDESCILMQRRQVLMSHEERTSLLPEIFDAYKATH